MNFDAGDESLYRTSAYPYLFNMVPPIFVYIRALVQYLVQNNLKKIALIHLSDAHSSSASNKNVWKN